MKKIILACISIIFLIGIFLFSSPSAAFAQAGGTCSCSINTTSRLCERQTNNCTSGYQPSCTTTIGSCRGTTGSCTCVPSTTQNCAPAGSHCSATTPCCSPYVCEATTRICTGANPHITPYNPLVTSTPTATNTCDLMQGAANQAACKACMDDNQHVWTAIGCVEASSNGLISTFLPFGIGIAGGIAFLLILFGALQMMTSAGNPEKLNAGKELVTAAITGLLLIIFSIFLLQLIGVKILRIPGFA